MTTLFYLYAYAAIIAFCVLAACKFRSYFAASPLHLRWEIYPIAHEGEKLAHGGSYMEDTEWWTKPRSHDVLGDIKVLLVEVLFLHATFEHNLKLWVRTYPFHLGLYMLMGGIFLTCIAAVAKICGAADANAFLVFLGNVNSAICMVGLLGIAGGGMGLVQRRLADKGLARYTTFEHFFSLGLFIIFALSGLAAWAFNPSFHALSRDFLANLFTANFVPFTSTIFAIHLFLGLFLAVWLPLTFMGHLLMKYFMYHDIRWEDTPTSDSVANQKKIDEALKFPVSWSADHIQGDGKKTWVEVALANPAAPKND